MVSQYEHADPDRKSLTIQVNHTYANVITMLLAGMIGIANDRTAIVFKDNLGRYFKTLQDASGDGTMPQNSIPYIDNQGRATYDSEFSIDLSNSRIHFPLPFTLAFGPQETNGSMRIRVTTDGIWFGKREAGSWTEAEFSI